MLCSGFYIFAKEGTHMAGNHNAEQHCSEQIRHLATEESENMCTGFAFPDFFHTGPDGLGCPPQHLPHGP